MGKGRFDYFDAIENIVEYACKGAEKLVHIVRNYDPESIFEQMNEMHKIENDADIVNHEINDRLAVEFITPIDRDDILALSQCLDQVVDSIEELTMRFYMYDIQKMHHSATDMVMLIEKSVNALRVAMVDFKNFKKSKTIQKLLIDVSDYEEAADKTYVMALRRLHVEHRDDPLYVMEWDAVIARMEKCCDACAHAADMMSTIITKNS